MLGTHKFMEANIGGTKDTKLKEERNTKSTKIHEDHEEAAPLIG